MTWHLQSKIGLGVSTHHRRLAIERLEWRRNLSAFAMLAAMPEEQSESAESHQLSADSSCGNDDLDHIRCDDEKPEPPPESDHPSDDEPVGHEDMLSKLVVANAHGHGLMSSSRIASRTSTSDDSHDNTPGLNHSRAENAPMFSHPHSGSQLAIYGTASASHPAASHAVPNGINLRLENVDSQLGHAEMTSVEDRSAEPAEAAANELVDENSDAIFAQWTDEESVGVPAEEFVLASHQANPNEQMALIPVSIPEQAAELVAELLPAPVAEDAETENGWRVETAAAIAVITGVAAAALEIAASRSKGLSRDTQLLPTPR